MSIRALQWALESAPVEESGEFAVLVCLADLTASDGTSAWPAVKTIARTARLSERKVQYILRTLEARRIIRRGDQSHAAKAGPPGRRPTVWDLDLTLIREPAVQPAFTDAAGEPGRGAPDDAEGCTDDVRGVHGVHPNQVPNQLHTQVPPSGARGAPHQSVTEHSQPEPAPVLVPTRQPWEAVPGYDDTRAAYEARLRTLAEPHIEQAARQFRRDAAGIADWVVYMAGQANPPTDVEAAVFYAEQRAESQANQFDRWWDLYRAAVRPGRDARRAAHDEWVTRVVEPAVAAARVGVAAS